MNIYMCASLSLSLCLCTHACVLDHKSEAQSCEPAHILMIACISLFMTWAKVASHSAMPFWLKHGYITCCIAWLCPDSSDTVASDHMWHMGSCLNFPTLPPKFCILHFGVAALC